MEGFGAEPDTLADLAVEVVEQLAPGRNAGVGAGQLELVAAGGDADTQPVLDLPQVPIELATEHGQVAGIVRLQGEACLCRRGGRRFAVQVALWPQGLVGEVERIYRLAG